MFIIFTKFTNTIITYATVDGFRRSVHKTRLAESKLMIFIDDLHGKGYGRQAERAQLVLCVPPWATRQDARITERGLYERLAAHQGQDHRYDKEYPLPTAVHFGQEPGDRPYIVPHHAAEVEDAGPCHLEAVGARYAVVKVPFALGFRLCNPSLYHSLLVLSSCFCFFLFLSSFFKSRKHVSKK